MCCAETWRGEEHDQEAVVREGRRKGLRKWMRA